jgi:hypothetical protein
MPLVLSVCNRTESPDHPYRDVYFLELHVSTREVRPIELPPEVRDGTTGATGLTQYPGGWIAVLPPSTLVYLNEAFEVRRVLRLDELTDGHAVAWRDGAAYVLSTGEDRILRVEDSGQTSVYWEASPHRSDTVHLNGILWDGDHCLVTAFGRRDESLWRQAGFGYLYDVTTNRSVMQGICHPQSPLAWQDGYWICESSRSSIVGSRGMRIQTPWSFPRGLARCGDMFYVGTNVVRSSAGRDGQCGIGVVELTRRGARIADYHDLSAFADEIFAVVVSG